MLTNKLSDMLLLTIAVLGVASFAFIGQITLVSSAPVNTVNGIGLTLQVSGTCNPIISNALIDFGSVAPGSNAPTTNTVNVQDSGNTGSNIILYSTSDSGTGNWVYLSNSFGVSNTLWSATSGGASTALTNTVTTDSNIFVPASGSNDIYFGVNIPVGQAPGTYSQGITISLSC